MDKSKKIIISLLVVGLIATVLLLANLQGGNTLGSNANHSTISCTTSTVTAATVGTTTSTLLSKHSNRAWARIQQPVNASSSISLAFNAGASATANSGIILGSASTSPQVLYIDFGLNTDFPYTGDVTGIVSNTNEGLLVAGNASTSVNITECRY